MFSRLGSAFSSLKENVRSFAGKAFDTAKSSVKNVFRPIDVDDFPDEEKIIQEEFIRPTRSDIFSVIHLQMPEVKPAHGRRVEKQPEYARGMRTSGMFGVQLWPKEEELELNDPLSVFQNFAQYSQMDETPMTASFQQEVRGRAITQGLLDYDPVANYNSNTLPSEARYVSKSPALSKVARVENVVASAPKIAPAAVPIAARVAPVAARPARSLADAWLMGKQSLDEVAAGFRDRALSAAAI